MMNDGRRGFGFEFGFGSGDLAFLRGLVCLLAWLVGVESGSKVVFVGLLCFCFCFCLCLALLLVLLGESLVQEGKRGRVLVVR